METVPSLFRRIFLEQNSVPNPVSSIDLGGYNRELANNKVTYMYNMFRQDKKALILDPSAIFRINEKISIQWY